MLKYLKSRTIQLALLQAASTILAAVVVDHPEIAILGVFKSVVDILLRIDTTETLK